MPNNTLRENLHLCISKLKRSSKSKSPSSITTPQPSPEPTKPTPQKPHNNSKNSQTVLFKNFNSLYNSSTSDYSSETLLNSTSSSSSTSSSFSDEEDPAIHVSNGRFFFSSPGRSKSIVHDEATSVFGGGGIAVPTYSPDPYMDFKRSMEEMIRAQGLDDARAHWDHLHDLLLCYLALNRQNTHKFIVGAFADLLVALLVRDGDGSPARDLTHSPAGERKCSDGDQECL
ncbi:transcription repressor OFP12 [Magnolia sinica]|uniref:transcription repressor OFP12 n=1 Tax=Magnolia sinica TaxID=86752 RepID=UPI00265AF48C|nr:transcription repressor OFP12 [Magnolia sinica]